MYFSSIFSEVPAPYAKHFDVHELENGLKRVSSAFSSDMNSLHCDTYILFFLLNSSLIFGPPYTFII